MAQEGNHESINEGAMNAIKRNGVSTFDIMTIALFALARVLR